MGVLETEACQGYSTFGWLEGEGTRVEVGGARGCGWREDRGGEGGAAGGGAAGRRRKEFEGRREAVRMLTECLASCVCIGRLPASNQID